MRNLPRTRDRVRWCWRLLAAAVIIPYLPAPGIAQEPLRSDSLLVFVSDAQSPLVIEEVRLRPNNNDQAREMIFSHILQDHPSGIFTLGDMVSLGFYGSSWKAFDEFLLHAHKAGIPVCPTLGNHELMFIASYGSEEFAQRFPWCRRSGYAVRAGKLAILMLNSNFGDLTDREEADQRSWLDSTAAAFESDSSVSAVIMACHHPPFTNSTIVSPSRKVRDSFVPIFLRYAKCRLFLSGHSHAFEHVRESGKDFLVIGGGGGLQQPVLTGAEARWKDLFPSHTETRMFHYVLCRMTAEGLRVTVRMVKDDFSGFEDAYELTCSALP